ncbi:4-hydroxythreonine-4-phosphate dehydrogenase [Azospirillaceae bacterium]
MVSAPLAVTMGEPAGIGGEIALSAWRLRRSNDVPQFFIIDDPERLARLARHMGADYAVEAISRPEETARVFDFALPVLPISVPGGVCPGRPDSRHAAAVIESIDRAVALTQQKRAAAVVTNPIQKSALYHAGFRYPGHTEYLAALAGVEVGRPVMMLVGGDLRVIPVTIHIPLAKVIDTLCSSMIVHCGRVAARALREDFGLDCPRLVVSGLNPHAGEEGEIGREEIDVILPAIQTLREEGVHVEGPLSADTLFHALARTRYDVALCMYHDQALIPVKTLDFESGVNVTLGLPFIRTSPDHGTALAIAGTGQASPKSLISALKMAFVMSLRRNTLRII